MRFPILLYLLDVIASISQSEFKPDVVLQRRSRTLKGHRVSQIGSFSCFRLLWSEDTKLENIIDARLVFVETADREIPVSKQERETLERAAVGLPTTPVCINTDAKHLNAEVVLYVMERGLMSARVSKNSSVKTTTSPPPPMVTTRHWLQRYEEILREADPMGKLFNSPPSGSCELVTMTMSTTELVPVAISPTPAIFRQGICRGSCYIDTVSRRKRCCKPTTLEDLEFVYTTTDGSRRFRRIARFLVTACGFR